MIKNRLLYSVRNAGIFLLLGCLLNNGCAPTYPKERLTQSLVEVCKREYKIDVQAKLLGRTIVVFIPLEELFDFKLDILPNAVEKIENVILTTSRVLFSTDAKLDFYMIIAADIKTTAAELILVRYVDDVYKYMHGWINRDDYRKRVLWQVNFSPKLLKRETFDFDVPEMTVPVFLAEQISQRLNLIFDSAVAYKVKVKPEFNAEAKQFCFSVVVSDPVRFEKIYVPIIVHEAEKTLGEYRFTDFEQVIVKNQLLRNTAMVTKAELADYKATETDALLTLPLYE
jgi:hypothetical protein